MTQNPDRVPLGEFGMYEREERPSIAIIGFETVNRPVPGFPTQTRDVFMVRWAPRGDNKSENVEYIDHVKRDKIKWSVIGPAFEAWQKGQDEPTSGTPLSAFAAVNRAEAERYRMMHVRTVEDLAEIGEDVIRQIPRARQQKELAQRFLAARPQIEQEAKIAEQARTLEQQAHDIAELRATLEAMSAKRGPGRPPKEQAA